MAKILLLLIVLVSLVVKSTQTEGETSPLFVGTSTPGGPNYIIGSTGEVMIELPLVKPVYRAVWEGRHLFFTSRNDESVSHFDRYTGIESMLITMEGRLSGIGIDRTISRLFVWIYDIGIRSFNLEGQDVITVASVQNSLDAPTLVVDEVYKTIYYIHDHGNTVQRVSYETSPNPSVPFTTPINAIFVGLLLFIHQVPVGTGDRNNEMQQMVISTPLGGRFAVLNVRADRINEPQRMNSDDPTINVTSIVLINNNDVYYTDLNANAVWYLVNGQMHVPEIYARNIRNPDGLCSYPSVVAAWGSWSEWITSGSVKTRSRQCLEDPGQVVIASVMCSGNSSETQAIPWNCPKLWRNCYGNGRCLPYYYGGKQIRSLATCQCNEGFTGLWCDLHTNGSSFIWPWMDKWHVRSRRRD